MAKQTITLTSTEANLAKLALRAKAVAEQVIASEFATAMLPVAEAHGVTTGNITIDATPDGAITMSWEVIEAANPATYVPPRPLAKRR